MDIKEKLRFLEQIQKPPEKEQQIVTSEIGIEQVIDGEIIKGEFGISFVRTKEYDINTQHGFVQLGQIDEVSPYFLKLAGKDENLLQMDLRQSLFFDTETTGLAGGSGTYIFLTGLGYFENNRFIIKQFFLRDFPDEPTVLHLIHEIFKRFNGIISFNGKSFDWPLLQTRFIYHRIRNELVDPPHLDLLHAARRIWKYRLKDCSLGNLENEIMNIRRNDDIPSFLIPQLYFEYLRTKNAQRLKQIFYHNEMDILSLVSLTILLHQIHKQPLNELTEKIDLRTLARHYENTNQWNRNISIYQSLLDSVKDQEEKADISLKLSFCYKRLAQWENAVALWHDLLATGSFRIEPYEELAKYFEHHARDFERAEEIVIKGLKYLDILEQLECNILCAVYRERLTYRLKRIQRKKSEKWANKN